MTNQASNATSDISQRSRQPERVGVGPYRRLKLALLILALCAAALPVLNHLTQHPGETVLLLMPPGLGAFLWFGWPGVRRIAWWKLALYPVMLTPILAGAEYLVAYIARGRMLWIEVFWALYFTIAWRLAWTVWKLTVGRIGEQWRRWGRRVRQTDGQGDKEKGSNDRGGEGEKGRHKDKEARSSDRTGSAQQHRRLRIAKVTMLIAPGRVMLTLFIFVPLAFGSLVHRIKVGNPTELRDYANLQVEPVSLRTDDGLVLSGWFLPDPNSDSTVVICHGAGANKFNFLEFMLLFRYQGYSSLIFDFRGHGGSDGHTCTFGLYEDTDVKAAVDWLKKERPEKARHVYGLGSSMGAMSLVRQAAEDTRIEAVVLDSCFASAPLMADQHLGRFPLIGRSLEQMILASLSLHAGRSFWDLDAREAIAAISPRPVLLIHGTEDVIIPPVNMDILYNCAKEPKDRWLGPGPHSNIMSTDFLEYQRRVLGFLDKTRRLQAQYGSAPGCHGHVVCDHGISHARRQARCHGRAVEAMGHHNSMTGPG